MTKEQGENPLSFVVMSFLSNNMKDSLFLKAAFSKETERPPVWMMRQAGRFMPEYWEIKNKYSFFGNVQNAGAGC